MRAATEIERPHLQQAAVKPQRDFWLVGVKVVRGQARDRLHIGTVEVQHLENPAQPAIRGDSFNHPVIRLATLSTTW